MSTWRNNRRILLGISGGIGAYKIPELVRSWIKSGSQVEIIMTKSAESFVTPLVLSTLTGRAVWREQDLMSAERGWQIPHISLVDWAELFVLAPCTANLLRICAQGDSSTLLGAALLAYQGERILFPAMNVHMWDHPATQGHLKRIYEMGYHVVDPDSGPLACGYEGRGRLPHVSAIEAHCWRLLYPKKDLKGQRVLITAGPTHEYIDPVRYISNPSSGKMGYALAVDAWRRGADVTLISGPTHLPPPEGVTVVPVLTATDMEQACVERMGKNDIIIKAAAVGDFRAADIAHKKMKRKGREDITLHLVQNPDIAAALGRIKTKDQFLVGFAAETDDLEKNARQKIIDKKLDMIVANDVSGAHAGFAVDTNQVQIFTSEGAAATHAGTKEEVAEAIWDHIIAAVSMAKRSHPFN